MATAARLNVLRQARGLMPQDEEVADTYFGNTTNFVAPKAGGMSYSGASLTGTGL